jgi:hypothetical protein
MPGIMTESIMGNLITVMAVIPTTGLITTLIHTIGHIIGDTIITGHIITTIILIGFTQIPIIATK